MTDPEEPASTSRTASQGDFEAMTQFFKRAMGFQGIPAGRLPKFHGITGRPGERSLREWIEEFEQLVSPLGMSDKEKARVLVEHLAGVAKEEVMCLSSEQRESVEEVLEALELCFTSTETVQSLTTAFHNRKQGDRETLADFSRALMRLYGRWRPRHSV